MTRISAILLLGLILNTGGCGGSADESAVPRRSEIILVTGATGTQGGAVARELLKRGYVVRGLTRDPESEKATALTRLGAEMVQGDFDDRASLLSSMSGAHGVFAVTNFWEHGYDKEVAHGQQLIDAAKSSGVTHFVFTSVAGAENYTGIPHFESKGQIEKYLHESGLNYSVVRPVSFMDNIHHSRKDLLAGVFYDPRDSGKNHQWIAASDIGFFVGEAFDNPDSWFGKSTNIAGDEMTLAEFADLLSRSLGLDIHHQQITWEAYEADAGEDLTLMTHWFDEKGYDVDVVEMRKLYPSLISYREYLQRLDWGD